MQTLNLKEAADLLKLHHEVLRRKAVAGEVPGRKVGKKWVFVEEHLCDFISGRFPVQGQALKIVSSSLQKSGIDKACQSTKEKTPGGSRLPWQTEREYKNLLGLK